MLNPKEKKTPQDDYDYLSNAASAGDCTGLIPSLPSSDAEIEAYNDLYQYLPPYSHAKANNSDKTEK